MNFRITNQGGTNIVLERDNGSARPATVEELEMFDRITELESRIQRQADAINNLSATASIVANTLTANARLLAKINAIKAAVDPSIAGELFMVDPTLGSRSGRLVRVDDIQRALAD